MTNKMKKRIPLTDNPYRNPFTVTVPHSDASYSSGQGYVPGPSISSANEFIHLTKMQASTKEDNNLSLSKRHRAASKISAVFRSLSPLNFSKSSSSSDTRESTKISLLEQENQILRQTIEQLERENELLEHSKGQRIIMENFEGAGKPMYNANGEEVDSTWWERENGDPESQTFHLGLTNRAMADDRSKVSGTSSISTTPSLRNANGTGMAFADVSTSANSAAVPALEQCDVYNDSSCPIEPELSFKDAFKDRAYWLVGLLTLQSMSGFILARNEQLLQTHPVIIYFLTMLVGAGGNAGNQAAVRVIRGIALGTLNEKTQKRFLIREFKMACSLSAILSLAGFIRATLFNTPLAETIAITTALAIIVFSSICFGAILPLILMRINVDPAHSSTSIQVIMDILGVVLTVAVSTTILDSAAGQMIISKLIGS